MNRDVLVLGAGIAGSVVARRLAQTGLRVVLVGGESRPGCEGISRRAVERLQAEGLTVPLPMGPRRGHWGGRVIEGVEYLVERAALARSLRAQAVAAGAVHCRAVARDLKSTPDGWQVTLPDGPRLRAASLIDARGRRGAALAGPKLLAVARQFVLPAPGETATQIEALPSGWCWWAQSGTRLCVQVTARPRDGHPARWVARAALDVPALASLLEGAVPLDGLQARAAHARLAAAPVDGTLWRVGDAAHALDPLSGQGVYEALRSAQLVATAVLAVQAGSTLSLAQQFVRDRQQASFEHAVNIASAFYRENAARSAFWQDTARAYERLAARAQLCPAGTPRIERRPVLIDGRIEVRDVVITAANPRGVWQVGGVPVVPLLKDPACAAPAHLESTAQRLGKPPAAVRHALRWLQQSGAAVAAAPAHSR